MARTPRGPACCPPAQPSSTAARLGFARRHRSFLPRCPSFLCPSMARLRWKATGARLESAEPALLPFLSRRSRPPIKAEPPLCPSPSFARCRGPPPLVKTPSRARTPTPRPPEALSDFPAPVGTPQFAFWHCFARLHPHPSASSLSSSRPPSTTSFGAFSDAAFPSRRLTVSPSIFP